jgi:transcriptional regulator with XRE-family HTH domain
MMHWHSLLLHAGRLLYGPSWQTPLATALGINLRTVQRWARGDRQPSADTWARLAELVRHRSDELAQLLDDIRRST